MKPVTQSRVGEDGTCFRACIASILEVPESRVPDFGSASEDEERWWDDIQSWLAKRGLSYSRVPVDGVRPIGYTTIEGVSPRGGLHACVAYNGELVHDPHPQDGTGRGLVEPRYYGVFAPLEGGSTGDANSYKTGGPRGPSVVAKNTSGRRMQSPDGSRWAVPVNKKLRLPGGRYEVVETWTLKRREPGGRVVTVATDRYEEAAKEFVRIDSRATDRADMLALRRNTEKQGGPFFMQETTETGAERTLPVRNLAKGADARARH